MATCYFKVFNTTPIKLELLSTSNDAKIYDSQTHPEVFDAYSYYKHFILDGEKNVSWNNWLVENTTEYSYRFIDYWELWSLEDHPDWIEPPMGYSGFNLVRVDSNDNYETLAEFSYETKLPGDDSYVTLSNVPDLLVTYTVTIETNGGTTDKTQYTFSGVQEFDLSTISIERDGYILGGWYRSFGDSVSSGETHYEKDEVITVDDDMILSADWNVVYYTVKLDTNGGTASKTEYSFAENRYITVGTINTPTRDGYKIDYYTIIKGGIEREVSTSETIVVDQDFTIKVYWIVNEEVYYTYTINPNGGYFLIDGVKNYTAQTLKANKDVEITLPIPSTDENFDFIGWVDKNGNIVSKFILTDDSALFTAKWESGANLFLGKNIRLFGIYGELPIGATLTNASVDNIEPQVSYKTTYMTADNGNILEITCWREGSSTISGKLMLDKTGGALYYPKLIGDRTEDRFFGVVYQDDSGLDVALENITLYGLVKALEFAKQYEQNAVPYSYLIQTQPSSDPYTYSIEYSIISGTWIGWPPKKVYVYKILNGQKTLIYSNEEATSANLELYRVDAIPDPKGDDPHVNESINITYADGSETKVVGFISRSVSEIKSKSCIIQTVFKDEDFEVASYNKDAYANAILRPYNAYIVFEPLEGTIDGNTQIEIGVPVTITNDRFPKAIPTNPEYEFMGWYKDKAFNQFAYSVTTSQENEIITLYARYDEKTDYTLIFETFGGIASESLRYTEFNKVESNFPTSFKTGYRFLGWYTEETEGELITYIEIKKHITYIYAHYEELTAYKLYFDSNGGTSDESYRDTYDTYVETNFPTPLLMYHKFLGWRDSFGNIITSVTISGDTTLTAEYSLESYVIEAKGNNSKAVFANRHATQWDYGQVLCVEVEEDISSYLVEGHFVFGNTYDDSVKRIGAIGTDGRIYIPIPDTILENAGKLNVYVYVLTSEYGQTEYIVEIPVIGRSKPGDYAPDTSINQFTAILEQISQVYNNIINVSDNITSYATRSIHSAESAAESAKAADESEANALQYSEEADVSRKAAASSASNAKTSETNAAKSESNASTSETNAKTSETNAAKSESNASTSETNAKTSETNAAKSESNASTSETNAASSAASAAQSADDAATSAASIQRIESTVKGYMDTTEGYRDAAGNSATEAKEVADNMQSTIEAALGIYKITDQSLFSSKWEERSGKYYYSFESDFPFAEYDLEIDMNGSIITQEQYDAWLLSYMTSSSTVNEVIAIGQKPSVDIPIIIKVRRISVS